MGGTDDRLWVLKYNAMRFNSDHTQFLRSLRCDVEQIWQQELGTKKVKPIKSLRKASPKKGYDSEEGDWETPISEIQHKLGLLARRRQHLVLMVDEIDALSRHQSSNKSLFVTLL